MVAYMWRFMNNASSPVHSRTTGWLTNYEKLLAEQTIIIEAQRQTYPEEYRTLQKSGDGTAILAKKNPLAKRSPYLERDGIVLIMGRFDEYLYVGDNTKRPIILPNDSSVTELIIRGYHWRYGHMNQRTIMNEVRQVYDIPALRSVCNKVKARCSDRLYSVSVNRGSNICSILFPIFSSGSSPTLCVYSNNYRTGMNKPVLTQTVYR